MSQKLSTRDGAGIAKRVSNREAFDTYGALSGEPTDGRWCSRGRLPREYRESDSLKRADYVIYSYATPIAWHVPGDDGGTWVQPHERYSVTTSKHQSTIRYAVSTL